MSENLSNPGALVGICMGSDSDWPTMQAAVIALDEFGVSHEVRVISAHRMPLEMVEYAGTAAARGIQVIIAGAGGKQRRFPCRDDEMSMGPAYCSPGRCGQLFFVWDILPV